MTKHELFREGSATTDGRFIEIGAAILPTEQIGLLTRVGEEGDPTTDYCGVVTNVHREGSRVYGDVEMLWGDEPEAITVDFDSTEFDVDADSDRLTMTTGRLIACNCSTKDSYPWKD